MNRWISASVIVLFLMISACSNVKEPPLPPSFKQEPVSERNEDTGNTAESSHEDPADSGKQEQGAENGPEDEKKIPESLYSMNNVYRFEPLDAEVPAKAVLLTFDDGPKEKQLLEQMLTTLEKHDAKAIFFVNGYRIRANPDLLVAIHERGHAIGNHAWDHIDLKKQNEAEVERQLADVQQIVQELTGEDPRFFRPPFGSGNDFVKQTAKKNGLLYMTWSNGSLDWDKSTKDKPDMVIKNVLDQLHPGANILMHELQWTADALDELLVKLKEKGYGFIDPSTIDPEPLNAVSAK